MGNQPPCPRVEDSLFKRRIRTYQPEVPAGIRLRPRWHTHPSHSNKQRCRAGARGEVGGATRGLLAGPTRVGLTGSVAWPAGRQNGASNIAPPREGGGGGGAGVCLKGRALWGKLGAVTKRLGRAAKSVGGQSLAVGNAGGGGVLGLRTCLRVELKEERWGGGDPLPSSKALGGLRAGRRSNGWERRCAAAQTGLWWTRLSAMQTSLHGRGVLGGHCGAATERTRGTVKTVGGG